jgi:hypothetical protein
VIYGLTLFEWAIAVGLIAAFFLIVVGVVGTIWPRRARSGDVLVLEFFDKLKVRSNVMAVGVLTAGVGLLATSGWAASLATPRFALSGKVVLDDGRGLSGISVGLIPPEHSTETTSTGTINKLDVPRPSGNATTYKAVVYYNDGSRLRAEIASVIIERNWTATIDHRFGRQ